MSILLETYKNKIDLTIAKIGTIEDFRKSDIMIDYIFETGRKLFEKPLDQWTAENLVAVGGRLSGVYGYLGQKSSRARTERDIFEQKLDEILNERTVNNYSLMDDKITLARAQAKIEVAELKELVILKELEKNNWENITDACQTMIMFIQSTLKIKQAERFINKDLQDNG
jgi:hypothetical protein